MKYFITGGTGFIGRAMTSHFLNKGHRVTTTGRSQFPEHTANDNFLHIQTDTEKKGAWCDAANNSDVIINLAGVNIFNYWTRRYKDLIYSSRINTTKNLVESLDSNHVKAFISTSAAGFYGSRGNEKLDENSDCGDDFLSQVCIDWENEAFKAEQKGIPTSVFRFGVVLGKNGGAVSKMKLPFKLFMGGHQGNGAHYFPWIHRDDLIAAIDFTLNHHLKGVFNTVSPQIVTNREFSKQVASALGRPSYLHIPSFFIRAFLGEFGQVLLNSQRVLPARLIESGFQFKLQELEKAVSQSI